ncbi:MAG: transposase [bacterium]|nr:transposase [bacterium]
MEKILDIYTDYLHASFGLATATGLSRLLDGAISHDQVTRMLSKPEKTSKELWLSVKSFVRGHESDEACLIFDDTIIEKPYTDENDLICWHWDHSKKHSVKGINLLTAFYHSKAENRTLPLRVPVGFETIHKTIRYSDIKTKKEKRKSSITKNELMRNMIKEGINKELKFRYILADTWFASAENMNFIHKQKKFFIFDMKYNRLAALTESDRGKGIWTNICELMIPEHTPVQVYLKGVKYPLLLIKQVFTNKDGSTGVRYLVSNDLDLTDEDFEILYKKRWSVEEYHKSIKQNTGIAKSPTRTIKTQTNHLYASILAYIKLEKYKFVSKLNHFSIKAKLYSAALKAAFEELKDFKNQLLDKVTA